MTGGLVRVRLRTIINLRRLRLMENAPPRQGLSLVRTLVTRPLRLRRLKRIYMLSVRVHL